MSDQSDQSNLSDKFMYRKPRLLNNAKDCVQYSRYFAFLAQESLSATVRLNTVFSAELSLSLQKYP